MEQALAKSDSQQAPHEMQRAQTNCADRLFTIGDMARAYNVTLRALRFYEDRGLIKPIRYGVSRYYDAVSRARFETILRGKKLGFTLGQIAAMLPAEAKASDTQETPRLDLKEAQVLRQITQLERKRSELDSAISELRNTHDKMTGRSADERTSAASAA
jgi:DNA-binding transcriptional MerR regulator